MNNIKIVIFGCDNTGKTTLAKNLAKSLNGTFHPSLGPANLTKQLTKMDNILSSDGVQVIDRWPILEEEVCGRVLRGKSNFDDINKGEWFKYYKNIDLFIHCKIPFDKIQETFSDREQLEGVEDNLEKLIKGYEDMHKSLKKSGCLVLPYNWTKDKCGFIYSMILKGIDIINQEKEETE